MKIKEIRDMSEEQLAQESRELRRALFNLRLQRAIGQLEKPHKLGETHRSLARVLTVMRQREAAKETR